MDETVCGNRKDWLRLSLIQLRTRRPQTVGIGYAKRNELKTQHCRFRHTSPLAYDFQIPLITIGLLYLAPFWPEFHWQLRSPKLDTLFW